MTSRRFLLCLLFAAVFWLFPGKQPFLMAGGNFLDSLQEPKHEGVSRVEESQPDSSEDDPQFVSATGEKPKVTRQELPNYTGPGTRVILNSEFEAILRIILAKFGFPPGTRIIIVSPPIPPRPEETPAPGPDSFASDFPSSSGYKPTQAPPEVKARMASKFGIKPLDGDIWWSNGQVSAVEEALEKLPEGFRDSTREIVREKDIPSSLNRSLRGRVYGFVDSRNSNRVHLLNLSAQGASVSEAKKQFQGTLVHEMAHSFQFEHPDIADAFRAIFWNSGRPRPPSVSAYGNTLWYEDFSESVRAYFQSGPKMKQLQPARYDFIRKYVMNGKEF